VYRRRRDGRHVSVARWQLASRRRPLQNACHLGALYCVQKHWNLWPHTAIYVCDWLLWYDWEVTDLPRSNPNLEPSDFQLFGLRNKHLTGKRLETDTGVRLVVVSWPYSTTADMQGYRGWSHRWTNAGMSVVTTWRYASDLSCILWSQSVVFGIEVSVASLLEMFCALLR
jgi:hypothetical protein